MDHSKVQALPQSCLFVCFRRVPSSRRFQTEGEYEGTSCRARRSTISRSPRRCGNGATNRRTRQTSRRRPQALPSPSPRPMTTTMTTTMTATRKLKSSLRPPGGSSRTIGLCWDGLRSGVRRPTLACTTVYSLRSSNGAAMLYSPSCSCLDNACRVQRQRRWGLRRECSRKGFPAASFQGPCFKDLASSY